MLASRRGVAPHGTANTFLYRLRRRQHRLCDRRRWAAPGLTRAGGEIFASDVVRQLVAGKGFLFADRGESALRGFEDPVRVYEVGWEG